MTPQFTPGATLEYTRTKGGDRVGTCTSVLDLDDGDGGWPKERHCRYVYRLDIEGVGPRTVCECRLRTRT